MRYGLVTAIELRFGLARNPGATRVRADLERRGHPIGPLDTIIAAHALVLGCVLVTNNQRELRRVPGLRCEDWTRSRR